MRPGSVPSPLPRKGRKARRARSDIPDTRQEWNPAGASNLEFVSGRPKSAGDALPAFDTRPCGPGCSSRVPVSRALRRELVLPMPGTERPVWTRSGRRKRRSVRSDMAHGLGRQRDWWGNCSHEVCWSSSGATLRCPSPVQPRKRGILVDSQHPAAWTSIGEPTAVASAKALTGRTPGN